jgi:hypothetical protein
LLKVPTARKSIAGNESDALLASYGQVGVLSRTLTCVFRMPACSESIATSPRGFSGAAKRATLASMSWHHVPNYDAWKQAHHARLVRLGKRAWLHFDDCRHCINDQVGRPRLHQFDMQIRCGI